MGHKQEQPKLSGVCAYTEQGPAALIIMLKQNHYILSQYLMNELF